MTTRSVLLESPRLGPQIRAESPPNERERSSSLSSLSPLSTIPQTARPPVPPPTQSSTHIPACSAQSRLDHRRHQLPERHSGLRVNANGHLLPPLPTRNFAISPPASPPVDWVSREEDGPNMLPHADDLASRLDQLAVNSAGQYCVFDPEVHYVDSDSDESTGAEPTPRPGSEAAAGPLAKKGFIIPPIFVIRDGEDGEPASPSLQPPFGLTEALTASPPTPMPKLRTALPPLL